MKEPSMDFLRNPISSIIQPKHQVLEDINEGYYVECTTNDTQEELKSCKKWEDLNIPFDLLKGLYLKGFNAPSKIQELALPLILNSTNNLIAQAQNGSGKTATFALAMLAKIIRTNPKPQCLCICHTRELAHQNMDVVRSIGQCTNVTYWLAVPQSDYYDKTNHAQIIIGTPGKIRDGFTKRLFPPNDINLFVLDEADVLIDHKSNVAAQVNEIRRSLRRDLQILLFSATYPERVMQFVSIHVPNASRLEVKKEKLNVSSISQFYIECSDDNNKLCVLSDLYGSMTIGQSIIFVNTRNMAFHLAEQMKLKGHAVSLICGTNASGIQSMDHITRETVMREFRNGETKVLISTDILSRGIDVPQVTLVVNFDLPFNRNSTSVTVDYETYLHRIGRTGRFGSKGLAFSFILPDEKLYVATIANFFQCKIQPLQNDLEVIEDMLHNLRK